MTLEEWHNQKNESDLTREEKKTLIVAGLVVAVILFLFFYSYFFPPPVKIEPLPPLTVEQREAYKEYVELNQEVLHSLKARKAEDIKFRLKKNELQDIIGTTTLGLYLKADKVYSYPIESEIEYY